MPQKSFEELREELNESRLLRKGVALTFAAKARSEGQKIEREVNAAKQKMRPKAGDSIDEQVRSLQEGMLSIGDAMVAQRKMMGALVAICLSGQLLSERTNKQIEQLMKK
ncbi:hypothetical protein N9W88_03615 [Alphaproteobacteria bacterium]|nr:hypothetical protein [Alphaproteobacteria bacterium]